MSEQSTRPLFASDVILEEVTPLPGSAPLLPAELAMIAAAGWKRRREFAAGRDCARRALARLGIARAAIPAGPDRAPLWPPGVVGSISHTDRYCVAVVARRSTYAAVGIDAEPDQPLESELWPLICVPDELRWLASQPEHVQGRLARLIFSAKECTYKCQYPRTGEMLEFHDVQISLDLEAQSFAATRLTAAQGEFRTGTSLAGTFALDGALIRTGMAVAATTWAVTG